MGSGRGETPSTSISIFPFTGGQDKSGVETWQRRPAAPQLPVARMARRGGAASRAPSLLPPFTRAPRSSARLLGSGPGGVWAGEREERVAACPWSAGLQAPPAVPLSRAHPGGGDGSASQPRSQPQGRLGTCSPARPTLRAAFRRLLGPLGVSPPYQPSEQSCWKNKPGRQDLPGETAQRSQGKEGSPTCARWWRRRLEREERAESWCAHPQPQVIPASALALVPFPSPAERASGVSPSGLRVCVSQSSAPGSVLPLAAPRRTALHERTGVEKEKPTANSGQEVDLPLPLARSQVRTGKGWGPSGTARTRVSRRAGVWRKGRQQRVDGVGGWRREKSLPGIYCNVPGAGASWAPSLFGGEFCAGRASSAGQGSTRRLRR
ncbi:PREDICTED: putative uncharacterized protein C3orf53 [Colobus angolensis palliatus]|uniref:putative uncharacterized protein C3orf53 n=1 Tax=Colobus angolensis palliatus TaxID=336983 RepID=UPI0005F3A225|nr:PREDICTED: putative uncharacterized protein C3orf53 [Colobus angolensis palliatus]